MQVTATQNQIHRCRKLVPASCLLALAALLFQVNFSAAIGSTAAPPYKVVSELLTWRDAARNRDIPVKIYAPVREQMSGKLPVVVFSHGFGEQRDAYEYLGQYWAKHGYLAVFLTHYGSDRESFEKKGLPRGDTANSFDPRPLDMRFAADMLLSEKTGSNLLDGRVDKNNLAVAGQCAGSTTALYMTGLRLESTDGSIRQDRDTRYKAVIALGPQMPIRSFAPSYWAASAKVEGGSSDLYEGSWQKIDVPALVITGSEDFNYFPAIRRNPAMLAMAFDRMPPGDKYLLNIIGAEHQAFTDSEPWYPASPRDPRHHELIGKATTQFLDAFLKADADALQALRNKSLSRQSDDVLQQRDKTDPSTAGFSMVGQPVASAEADTERFLQMFSRLDTDANGRLHKAEIPVQMKRLLKGFERLDKDASGDLSRDEFVEQLSRYNKALHDANRKGAKQLAVTVSPRHVQGQYKVKTIEELILRDVEGKRELVLRATYPDAAGKFPLVLISHYAGGNRQAYDELTAFLSSHGYVCVIPDHADAISGRSGSIKFDAIQQRTLDLGLILDSLIESNGEQPLLASRIDTRRIATIGHYLGALMAGIQSGVRWYPAQGDVPLSMTDARVKAVVLISPTGLGQGLRQDSWDSVNTPSMTITGSGDSSQRTGKQAEWRTDGYRLSPAGDKYLVFIDGYHSKGDPSQPGTVTYQEAVGDTHAAYVYIAAQKFLDAYLKQDASAKNWLLSGEMSVPGDDVVDITYR